MTRKRGISLFIGLVVISVIIIIHELGHFFWSKFFKIPVDVFSIGFGPRLISIMIGQTRFQIAALPLGGYVSMNMPALQAAAYWKKMIIIFGGVFNNFACAFLVLLFIEKQIRQAILLFFHIMKRTSLLIIGIKSATESKFLSSLYSHIPGQVHHFLFFLATINIELAIFNLLPIPLLDGGHALSYTINAIASAFSITNPVWIHLTYIIIVVCFILLIYRLRNSIAESD